MKNLNIIIICIIAVIFLGLGTNQSYAQIYDTEEVSMMKGVSKRFKNGWVPDPIFTVGETNNDGLDYSEERFGHRLPGVIDGMYAFKKGNNKKRIDLYVNHELRDERGYPYGLANGTILTGARVTKLRIVKNNQNTGVQTAELAYHTIYDRYYDVVTDPAQLNEGANPGSLDGIDRLCSATGIEKGKFGFRNDIFFTGEETGPPFDARGGQEFALDVKNRVLYCAPAMGRAAWESVTAMENYDTDKVVILVGDDRGGAPLYLYVGQKNATFTSSAPQFLKRNGLAKGYLYAWVADNGDLDPEAWNGTGTVRKGKFIRINHYNPSLAGTEGYDDAGWADILTQDALADEIGNFNFSRPEDVATNPNDGTQAVMASTGRSSLYPSDSWGTTYLVDIHEKELYTALHGDIENINNLSCDLTIIYDGDDAGNGQFESPDYGLRSPDNLDWAENGYIYLNEDRSVGGFCETSEFEASVWQLDPYEGELTRILEMDRNAVPFKQNDSDPDDCGDWESSGVVDVTKFFKTEEGETLLLLNVQAHSIDNANDPDSPIGGDDDLSEGGQILFVSKKVETKKGQAINPASTNVQGKVEEKPLLAFPNPADTTLNIIEVSDVKLFDISGYLILEAKNAESIDVSKLQPGVYILRNEKGETQKIIIE